jgi:hypothetical protein
MVCTAHFSFNALCKRETLDQERILTVLCEKSTSFVDIMPFFQGS